MKGDKTIKLALIRLLSDADLIIEDFTIENEFENAPDFSPTQVPTRRLTGRKFIKLTVFKDEHSKPTPQTGKTEGSERTD